jgi:hypothetical protein
VLEELTLKNIKLKLRIPLVGGFVFPHGTITLDPETRDLSGQPAYLPTTKENCIKLHEAMKSQAEILVRTNPDLIIYTTPHGLKLKEHFLFVKNAIVRIRIKS